MGGNISVFRNGIKTAAEQIPLARIGRTNFTESVKDILYSINKAISCWNYNNIESGEIFNGSSQYVFSPEYNDDEIEYVKKSIGDVDIMIDKSCRDELLKFFDSQTSPDFKGYIYNESLDQIHSVFEIHGVNCQIDFEFTKFIQGAPSEFARFSHSSSFEDAEYGIKAVFHKLLIGAVTYTTAKNILIADEYTGNFIIPDKIPKFAVFSVVNGFKINYVPMYDKVNKRYVTHHGLQVFTKNKSPYSTNVRRFYKYLFNINTLENYDLFWSFIGVCELIKQNFPRDKVNGIYNKFSDMLCYHKVSKNPEEDRKLKYNAYKAFIDILGFEDFFRFLGI